MFVETKREGEIAVPVTEPWRKILLKAANLIKKRGLAKNMREVNGTLCLHGAIWMAMTGDAHGGVPGKPCMAEIAVYKYLKAQGVTGIAQGGCAQWNNAASRTKEEVIAALRGAAAS